MKNQCCHPVGWGKTGSQRLQASDLLLERPKGLAEECLAEIRQHQESCLARLGKLCAGRTYAEFSAVTDGGN